MSRVRKRSDGRERWDGRTVAPRVLLSQPSLADGMFQRSMLPIQGEQEIMLSTSSPPLPPTHLTEYVPFTLLLVFFLNISSLSLTLFRSPYPVFICGTSWDWFVALHTSGIWLLFSGGVGNNDLVCLQSQKHLNAKLYDASFTRACASTAQMRAREVQEGLILWSVHATQTHTCHH